MGPVHGWSGFENTDSHLNLFFELLRRICETKLKDCFRRVNTDYFAPFNTIYYGFDIFARYGLAKALKSAIYNSPC